MLIMISPSKLNCYNLLFCCSSICLMISPPPQGVNEVRLEPFEKVGEFQQTMGFCECVPILKGLPRNPKKKKKPQVCYCTYSYLVAVLGIFSMHPMSHFVHICHNFHTNELMEPSQPFKVNRCVLHLHKNYSNNQD